MRVVEDPVRVAVERLDVACSRVREAPDRHAAHAVGAFLVLVLPGDVVARAGRQDIDIVLGSEAFGDEPAQLLGPAEDFGAISLDDKG